MNLPEAFADRMKARLGAEWPDYRASLDAAPWAGLRLNPKRGSVAELRRRLPPDLELAPVPWTEDGFYYSGGTRPAKLPFYQAGLYYIQEPSAMAPAALLGVEEGDQVLDLCAAPGGKSTQIAARLGGTGLLVSNEIRLERGKALVWNLEHWGAVNTLVTNEPPAALAGRFPGFFDKVLADAPCSGEGMFRKEPDSVRRWTDYNGEVCRKLQDEILRCGARMLRPGGRMMYSTCTFHPLENEMAVAAFLEGHPDFSLVPLELGYGWRQGDLPGTLVLMPHLARGEGHFLAMVEKSSEAGTRERGDGAWDADGQSREWRPFLEFMEDNILDKDVLETYRGPFVLEGQYLYQRPAGLVSSSVSLAGLRALRPGFFLGRLKNGRFEPSQALAMEMKPRYMRRALRLDRNDPWLDRFLKGETLLTEGAGGWTLVCLEEWPLGFGKQADGYLKNRYHPGWRIMG
jgi:16S rRNA C967 or C1407 C5-methylase (RsmB/RsmF family)/NOL1/NOP2/fmu family ribosome biogenesis protein